MKQGKLVFAVSVLSVIAALLVTTAARAQQQRPSSFTPVIEEPFDVVHARDKAAKPRVMAAHQRLLEERYDLSRRVDESVRMTRGKPIPVGPTAKLKRGVTWEQLGQMSPATIRERDLFPYLPLPHVNHPVGGMVFPLFAAFYYWMPVVTGRMMSERLGRLAFWLMFVGFNLAFLPMHWAGLHGMPRRVFTYSATVERIPMF